MKKIMFDDKYGLTKAVLEGRKTMTRRIIKAPKTMEGQWVSGFAICKRPGSDEVVEVMALDADEGMINNILPKYKVGEVVAVAQSYGDIFRGMTSADYMDERFNPLLSKGPHLKNEAGWTNKMFVKADLMPHQIRITDVRVERLQDISEEDCLREGIEKDGEVYAFNDYEGYKTPQLAFAALFDKINGKGTWKSNPRVFVYDFELVK